MLAQCPAVPPVEALGCNYYVSGAATSKTEALVVSGASVIEVDGLYLGVWIPVPCWAKEIAQQSADDADREFTKQATAERRHQEILAALQSLLPQAQTPPQVPAARRNGIVSAALLGFALGLGPRSAAGRGIGQGLSPSPQFDFQQSWDQLQRDNAVIELQRIGFSLSDINDALRQLNIPR